jgi:hypothetical protein
MTISCIAGSSLMLAQPLQATLRLTRWLDPFDRDTKDDTALEIFELRLAFARAHGIEATQNVAPTLAGPEAAKWAILDSNQGPPPYQSGALTD